MNGMKKVVIVSMAALWMTGCAQDEMMPAQMTSQLAAPSTPTAAVLPPPKMVNDSNVTLTNLNMNNLGNQIMIKPGRTIQATIDYQYHCQNCNQSLNNQILIGLAKRSAQACIYNGGIEGQGSAQFTLKVPAKPGKYDVRYRGLQAVDCNEALKTGWNADNSPSKQTTLGTIIVSRKADSA